MIKSIKQYIMFFIFCMSSYLLWHYIVSKHDDIAKKDEVKIEMSINQIMGYSIENKDDALALYNDFHVIEKNLILDYKMDNNMDLSQYEYAIPFIDAIDMVNEEDKHYIDTKVNVLYMEKDGIIHSVSGKMKITNELYSQFKSIFIHFKEKHPEIFERHFHDNYVIYENKLAYDEMNGKITNPYGIEDINYKEVPLVSILQNDVKRADIFSKLKYPGFSTYYNVQHGTDELSNITVNHEKEVIVDIKPLYSDGDLILSDITSITNDKDGIIPETSVHKHLWMIPSNDYHELYTKINDIHHYLETVQNIEKPKNLTSFISNSRTQIKEGKK